MRKIDLSIIIPAFNEEKNIASAILSVTKAVKDNTTNFEIIVVNDGSTDKTKFMVEREMKRNLHLKLVSRTQNKGLGFSFQEGLSHAALLYVTLFPGDNDMSASSLVKLISEAQNYDLVISYPINRKIRPFPRRVVSTLYVLLLNLIFGLHLQYYNGPFLGKTKLIQETPLISKGHNVFAELLIRLLKKGVSYTAVPFEYTGRAYGKSKAFTLTNIRRILVSFSLLVLDIQILKRFQKA